MISMGQTVKQTKSTIGSDQYLDIAENETYWYRASSSDVVTQADTLLSWTIGVDNMYDQLKQYVQIKLTENSGTAAVNVKFQGKTFWDDSFTDLLDVTYAGTGTDTTIIFDGSTAKHYRFYKVLLDGDGTGTFNVTATKQEVKFYK